MRLRSSDFPTGRIPPVADRITAIRKPIGQVLDIDKGVGDDIARRQAETGRLFGETAVELGIASEDQVRRAIEEQQCFAVLDEGDDRLDPLVIAAFHPDDPLSRAAREIRSIVTSARGADGGIVQTLAVVGMGVAAESSVLVANLAVACAQAGHRTLLIDSNLDRPQHHVLFRLTNRVGVSTLLSAGHQPDDAAQPSVIPMLSVMTAGPAVPNAPELLDRQRLARSIAALRSSYDLLIVDASSADEAGLDACFGLDAAIVVLGRGVSGVREMRGSIENLQDHGVAVLGTILTN